MKSKYYLIRQPADMRYDTFIHVVYCGHSLRERYYRQKLASMSKKEGYLFRRSSTQFDECLVDLAHDFFPDSRCPLLHLRKMSHPSAEDAFINATRLGLPLLESRQKISRTHILMDTNLSPKSFFEYSRKSSSLCAYPRLRINLNQRVNVTTFGKAVAAISGLVLLMAISGLFPD